MKKSSSSNNAEHETPGIGRRNLAGWTPDNRKIYMDYADRLLAQGWKIVADSLYIPKKKDGFTDSRPEPGAMFTWVVFYHSEDMRSLSIWQFGNQVKGADGVVHGGAISTAIDHSLSAQVSKGFSMSPYGVTLKLEVNYLRYLPLETAVIIEGKTDKVEGKKYYTSSIMKSLDRTITYNKSTAIFILLHEDKVIKAIQGNISRL